MPQMLALVIVIAILFIGDFVSTRTKGLDSLLFS